MKVDLDHPWNMVFLAGFFAYILIRRHYAESVKHEKSAVRRIDILEKGLMGFVMLGSLLAPILYLFTPLFRFADNRLPPFAPWVGTATMVVALWMFRRSHVDLGRHWSISLEVREGHRLITHGVYRRIRHPMYLAIWLWSLAQLLLLENWLAGCAALVTFAPMYILRTPREEALMLETFGDEYRSFIARSGRILPRPVERSLCFVSSSVATLWVVYTLYTVLRYGGAVVLDAETTGRIFGVNKDGRVVSGLGLTYHGVRGAVLVVVEIVAVGISLLAAHLASAAWRAAGLTVLVAWAVLWFGNAVWLQGQGWDRPADTVALTVALVATVLWLVTSRE